MYIKTALNSTFSTITKIWVKTSSTTWTQVNNIWVKTNASTWSSTYTPNSTYSVQLQDSAGNLITSAHIGDKVYGYPGDGTTGTWTYAFQSSTDGGSSWSNTTSSGGGTGTGTGVNKYYHTLAASDDKSLIRFTITQYGTTYISSTNASVTKYKPVVTTDAALTGTALVGSTLSVSSSWKATTGSITNDTLPDYYIATWVGQSGTSSYDSSTNSSWYQYTIPSGDSGSTISVYVTAYNSGGNTATSTKTSASVTVDTTPKVTTAPTLTGTGVAGTSLTAHAGSYTGGTVTSTKIAFSTASTAYSGISKNAPTATPLTSPHTVTTYEASTPADYFWTVDTISGNDGSTYYSYSAYVLSSPAPVHVSPSAPTSPLNSFTSGTYYDYTCSWTASTTGTAPISYYLVVYGGSSQATATNYVGIFGPSGALGTYTGTDGGGWTGTTGSYTSTYSWNNFQVYAVNYDGSSYYASPNSVSSNTA